MEFRKEKRHRNDLYGVYYEKKACKYLDKIGYEVYGKYRCIFGEIDILAYDKKNDEFVLVDVKARKNDRYGYGREAIDEHRLFRVQRIAKFIMHEQLRDEGRVRYDVIEFHDGKPTYIKNVQF